MSSPKQVHVAVIGLGGVGQAFLAQLSHLQHTTSKQNPAIDLRLILARRSKEQVISKDYAALDPKTIISQKTTSNTPSNELLDYLTKAPGPVILVDNTSDPDLASTYLEVLKKGISVITPNKKAFSADLNLWNSIFSVAANGTGPPPSGNIFHESTVGAGLPVLSTLTELLATGDSVTKIEGVFSGTMSFLFNAFMPVGGGGGSFAAEVSKAKDLGFTEPDPRDDLNGLDVARKLTILARMAGLQAESPTSFPVQSLIPKDLESCKSGDEFMQKLPEYDGEMSKLKDAAAQKGKVLRFVGSIDVGARKVNVGLEEFDASHPIAALKGSDNIINFYTKRYGDNPLIIQGAGAGGEVTAMGVTGDLIRVLRLLR